VGLALSCSAAAWLTQLCPVVCAVPWMHLSCQEKADIHHGASALPTACHVPSEVLETMLRTEEAQHTSSLSPTWPQDGRLEQRHQTRAGLASGEAAGDLAVGVVSGSSRSIR